MKISLHLQYINTIFMAYKNTVKSVDEFLFLVYSYSVRIVKKNDYKTKKYYNKKFSLSKITLS